MESAPEASFTWYRTPLARLCTERAPLPLAELSIPDDEFESYLVRQFLPRQSLRAATSIITRLRTHT
jgi:hypothetical protein